MSLDENALVDDLEALSADLSRAADDPESVWFGRDMTAQAAAELWAAAVGAYAAAVGAYAAGVVPASTTVAAATATLESALATVFGTPVTPPATCAPAMEAAFAAFATTVGGGMSGAGFTGTPPPGPVGFAALFADPPKDDAREAAEALAGAIHAWMTTGTATLTAPPNTVVSWG